MFSCHESAEAKEGVQHR